MEIRAVVSGAVGESWAFLRFEHEFHDGLHTYTARADSTLVNEVWRGLQDLAPYPDDPGVNPMDLFGISNFAGERLAVWRAIAWAVTEGLHRCGIPQWDRDNAATTLGIDRQAMRLVRWEHDIDHEDVEEADLGSSQLRPAYESIRRRTSGRSTMAASPGCSHCPHSTI